MKQDRPWRRKGEIVRVKEGRYAGELGKLAEGMYMFPRPEDRVVVRVVLPDYEAGEPYTHEALIPRPHVEPA